MNFWHLCLWHACRDNKVESRPKPKARIQTQSRHPSGECLFPTRGVQVQALASSPGGLGKYRFYGTHVLGPCTRTYNVPNDCTLAHSAGCVHNKHHLAEAHRHWPLASLAECPECCWTWSTPCTVRGGPQHLRPSLLPQRCFRYITRLHVPHSQVRCRASSDTVMSLAVDGSMSVCHHPDLPTADKARQHPREGPWFIHGWASMVRCVCGERR